MPGSASSRLARHFTATVIATVGGFISMLDPAESIIGGLFILLGFAIIAGLFARPPLAASAGICAGMTLGAYLNRDNFADDPGFPAMLVPLGMVALIAIAAAFVGNTIAREYRKGR